mmetsp:Transcript_17917/g.43059  ORF Transcript_17917/g.43059 Transcript_17917/m.43059 type:complete len:351 (-) Transcript_17917:527-1579(-)
MSLRRGLQCTQQLTSFHQDSEARDVLHHIRSHLTPLADVRKHLRQPSDHRLQRSRHRLSKRGQRPPPLDLHRGEKVVEGLADHRGQGPPGEGGLRRILAQGYERLEAGPGHGLAPPGRLQRSRASVPDVVVRLTAGHEPHGDGPEHCDRVLDGFRVLPPRCGHRGALHSFQDRRVVHDDHSKPRALRRPAILLLGHIIVRQRREPILSPPLLLGSPRSPHRHLGRLLRRLVHRRLADPALHHQPRQKIHKSPGHHDRPRAHGPQQRAILPGGGVAVGELEPLPVPLEGLHQRSDQRRQDGRGQVLLQLVRRVAHPHGGKQGHPDLPHLHLDMVGVHPLDTINQPVLQHVD